MRGADSRPYSAPKAAVQSAATAGIVAFAVLSLIALAVLSRSGARMTDQQGPLIHASMEIKAEISLFHVWLEELLAGDTVITDKEVW